MATVRPIEVSGDKNEFGNVVKIKD